MRGDAREGVTDEDNDDSWTSPCDDDEDEYWYFKDRITRDTFAAARFARVDAESSSPHHYITTSR